MALDYPFGIGPLQFASFPEDPHNSYLNAFIAGGWLSGACLSDADAGDAGRRHCASCSCARPGSRPTIAVFAAYLGVAAESFIIDTDHWRHYFLILGVLWGLMAVSRGYQRSAGRPRPRRNRPPIGLKPAPLRSPAGQSYTFAAGLAERSAARLAHQSGGLGVASSNLAAPTNYFAGSNSIRPLVCRPPTWLAFGGTLSPILAQCREVQDWSLKLQNCTAPNATADEPAH